MKEIKVFRGVVRLLTSVKELEDYFLSLERDKLTFDWETTGLEYDAIPLGLSLHQRGSSSIFIANDAFFSLGVPLKEISRLCNKYFPRFKLIAHNAKYDSMINAMNGIKDECCNIYADTLGMIHLYDASLDKKLEKRVKEDFGYEKKTFDVICGKKWNNINWSRDGDSLLELLAGYAGEDTYWETQVYYKYEELLDEDAWRVHNRIELPMISILRDAKIRGVLIDIPLLTQMGKEVLPKMEDYVSEIYSEAGCIFNLNSPKQKKEVFFDKMGLPVLYSTKKGEPSTDAKTYEGWAEMGFEIGNKLQRYSELNKLNSGYIQAIPNLVDSQNVLRGDINSFGTETGRACIEETQQIMTVGGLKPIKNIEVGDMVYCYDDGGNVRIRPVLNKWCKGTLPLVSVKYLSTGDNRVGHILCTPDHYFKTKKRGWVMAKNLKREKVYHLRRSDNYIGDKNRPRLYGTNSLMELEQTIIKNEFFHSFSREEHIHHVDGNPANNNVDNLRVLPASEHLSYHTKQRIDDGSFVPYDCTGCSRVVPSGEDSPKYIRKSRYTLLRMLADSGGKPTLVPMDFDTYKGKCSLLGINLSEVCKRFNNSGRFIFKGDLKKVSELTTRRQQSELSLGYYRVQELMEYYGVTNHLILTVSAFGEGICYDIEVEEFNNFICEEVCVHNSSSNPNLQNQPNNHDFPIRKAFIPRPGYVFINYDYSQLELRVMAHMSKDKHFLEVFRNGEDPHSDVAKRLGITRKGAKVVNFGVLYGMGPDKLAGTIDVPVETAKKIIQVDYMNTYSGFAKWKEATENFAKKHGYVKNLFGRCRKLPEATKDPYHRDNKKFYSALRQAVNTIIQGTGADIVKLATIAMCKEFKKRGLDAHFLLQVHDEVLIEARIDQMLEVEKIVIDCMRNTVKLDVPLEVDGKILLNWSEAKDEDLPSFSKRFDFSLFTPLIIE